MYYNWIARDFQFQFYLFLEQVKKNLAKNPSKCWTYIEISDLKLLILNKGTETKKKLEPRPEKVDLWKTEVWNPFFSL